MIEVRERKDRKGRKYKVYRVRAAGIDRTLPRGTTRKQAEQWETKVKQLAATGQLDQLDAGSETLAEFVDEWWEKYAAINLAHNTLEGYASQWNLHLHPRLGGHRLREIKPEVVSTLIVDLERDGVGKPTIRRSLAMLQGVMQRAVEWGRIPANPVKAVAKPSAPRDKAIRPLTPADVERLRSHLDQRDATIVSLLAYSGPRPAELLTAGLCWPDVGEQTLLYRQPKTKRAPRPVRLTPTLAFDVRQWRLALGQPITGPVIPARDGGPWDDEEWRYWRRNVFQPAAVKAGLATLDKKTKTVRDGGKTRRVSSERYEGLRAYDLRHTWASLLIREGKLSVVEIAAEMGHSTQTLLSTYAHVIAEYAGRPIVIEDEIRAARVPIMSPQALGGNDT